MTALLAVIACSPAEETQNTPEPEVGQTNQNVVGSQVAPEQAAGYPLNVCIVSGEELGSMGDPISQVHNGQTIKFCCKNCVPNFEENPEKYLTKLTTEQK